MIKITVAVLIVGAVSLAVLVVGNRWHRRWDMRRTILRRLEEVTNGHR